MSEIDDYLSGVNSPLRKELDRIRKIIKRNVPDAEELISYGMPGFKYKYKYLIGYAAFRNHMSIFPTASPVEALKDELSDYKTSKGTVQFTLDKPITESIIKKLLAVRINEINKSQT